MGAQAGQLDRPIDEDPASMVTARTDRPPAPAGQHRSDEPAPGGAPANGVARAAERPPLGRG